MNTHALLDEFTIRLSSLLLGRSKFFTESIDSAPILDVIEDTTLPDRSQPIHETSKNDPAIVEVETPTGTYEAAVGAWQWKRSTRPTIVFHHGSGENPFDEGRFASSSLDRIFEDPSDIEANIVAVRAPFHDLTAWKYARSMGDLSKFVGMLASSTALVQAVTEDLHAERSPAVVVSGISLGGWVTTLHQTAYDSAELYAPIFAGDRLGEMFVSSAYRGMTSELARMNPERLTEVLDYRQAYADVESPTRPLLARYDRIIEYGVQQPAYDDEVQEVIDYGHVTGSLQAERLRQHVVDVMIEAPGRDV